MSPRMPRMPDIICFQDSTLSLRTAPTSKDFAWRFWFGNGSARGVAAMVV